MAGLATGLFTEWRFRPFMADNSLTYFLKNLTELTPVTLLMIARRSLFCILAGKGSRLQPAAPKLKTGGPERITALSALALTGASHLWNGRSPRNVDSHSRSFSVPFR